MIKGVLKTLEKKNENYNNTTFVLYPVVNQPPTLVGGLLNSFKQYTWVDQISEGEFVSFKNLQQTTNKITMLEGTSFAFQPVIEDPHNIKNVFDLKNITYRWTRNDSPLYEINALNKLQGTGSIMLQQAKRDMSGIYELQISNKVGVTVSDQVEIDIISKDNYPLFYSNLILNSNGLKGVEDWIADADFTTQNFVDLGFGQSNASIPKDSYWKTRKQDAEISRNFNFHFSLRKNEMILRNWFLKTKTIDVGDPSNDYYVWRIKYFHPLLVASEDDTTHSGFFPACTYIDKANKNPLYGLQKNIVDGNTYFTRDRIKFTTYGGKASCTAYQDIDVTEVANIVDGQAYGIDRLVAHFFAYIGTGITRYKTKYVTRDNEYIENNTIPLSQKLYESASRANDIEGTEVKPPVIPYIKPENFVPYTRQDVLDLINGYAPKGEDGNPSVVTLDYDESDPQGLTWAWPDMWKTGLGDFQSKILASNWWVGYVRRADGTPVTYGKNTFRIGFARRNGSEPTIPGGDATDLKLTLFKEIDWLKPYKPAINSITNKRVQRKTALFLKPNEPFNIEPITDDVTDIRLDFLDIDNNTLRSELIKGPTAKDMWAVKEKFFMPFYIGNTYSWITDLTSQAVKIFNKTYTTIDAVKLASTNTGRPDLYALWIKAYHYRLFDDWEIRNQRIKDVIWDVGGSAMFGVSADIVVPVQTRRIRVNIIFNHTSNVIYDNNPQIKGWNKQEIYYDYLSNVESDQRYYEYGNPRCGVTAMHLSLHPNNVEVTDKHITYKIPPGNVWYKQKQLLESDNDNYFNSIQSGGGPQGNETNIDSLVYPYNVEPDDAEVAFTITPPSVTTYDLENLRFNAGAPGIIDLEELTQTARLIVTQSSVPQLLSGSGITGEPPPSVSSTDGLGNVGG